MPNINNNNNITDNYVLYGIEQLSNLAKVT